MNRELSITSNVLAELCRLDKAIRRRRAATGEKPFMDLLDVDPDYLEIRRTIKSFSQEQRRELAALIWLGKRYYSTFTEAYDRARKFDHDPGFVNYLADRKMYEALEHGIEILESSE